MIDPKIVEVVAPILVEFVKFAAPFVLHGPVDLHALAAKFWGDRGLGPMPPDLQAWKDLDAAVDKERAAQKGGGHVA